MWSAHTSPKPSRPAAGPFVAALSAISLSSLLSGSLAVDASGSRGCSGPACNRAGASSSAGPFECNFLTDTSVTCMLPWPDNFFFAPTWNASAPPALTLTNNSLPVDDGGNQIDPVRGGYNDLKGFSPLGPILAYLPGLNLDISGLPRLWNISSSTGVSPSLANSAILAVNYATGVISGPHMHWIELDHSGDDSGGGTPYERATIVWPASRFNDSTTYIVAFRNLVDDEGVPLQPSDGFAAIRDKVPTSNPALEASRPRFERIFSALAQAGWDRATLTLAWDFTTNTQEDITGRFLSMRDDAFARIAALPSGVQYNITKVDDNPAANTSRRIYGQFFVPCYLPYRAVPALDSRLVLDADGKPVFQEFVPFNFEVVIPTSVAQGGKPAKVVQYGHGLFGDLTEVEGGYLANEGTEYGYVWAASDWIGLSEYDEPTVIVMITESFTDFALVPDRLHQGMLNALVLMKMVTQSSFVNDPAVNFGGSSVISTNRSDWHYTGNSQGGIMGGVYAAASTDIERAVLGVGGGPYAVLLPRSTDFAQLFDVLKLKYPRSIDRMEALALIQALWDRMDPSGWAGYITAGGLPNTPAHRAIWHYGLGDAQVSWLGCHAVALSAGAVMFESNVHEGNETLTQFTLVPDSAVLTSGSAVMGFDYDLPQVPSVNIPPNDGYDAHECPRRTPQAQAQMAHFFYTGEIVNTCSGPCVVTPPPDGCAH